MQQVAALEDLEDRAFVVLVGGLRDARPRARRDRTASPGSASTRSRPCPASVSAQLAGHEPNAVRAAGPPVVLAPHCSARLHVVHDGQQGLDDHLGGTQTQLLVVAPHAFAVVLELGLEAAQVVEVLVALGDHLGELVASACGRRVVSPACDGRRTGRRPAPASACARSRSCFLLAVGHVLGLSVVALACSCPSVRPWRASVASGVGAARRERRASHAAAVAGRGAVRSISLALGRPRPSSWP